MYINQTRYDHPPHRRPQVPQELAIYDRLEELKIPLCPGWTTTRRHTTLRSATRWKGAGLQNMSRTLVSVQTAADRLLSADDAGGTSPSKPSFSPPAGVLRLSFADDGHMRNYLSTIPGSVSALELLFDTDRRVQLVIDRDLLADEFISGHPGLSTSTLQLKRETF